MPHRSVTRPRSCSPTKTGANSPLGRCAVFLDPLWGALLNDYKEQLKRVRKYTGNAFSPARGYSASKRPNFGQRMAVLKYDRKIDIVTKYDYVIYKPKRGEKTEVLNATSHKGYKFFNVAIIQKINRKSKPRIVVDKTRPKGSQVVLIDTRKDSKQRQYYMDASLFLEAIMHADEDEDLAIEYIIDVLEEYSSDAQFYLIKAGDFYQWGSETGLRGDKKDIAKKIISLLNNYNVDKFDETSSSYFGNWFAGVTGFTSRYDAMDYITAAYRNRRDYMDENKIDLSLMYTKIRMLKDGTFARYESGIFRGLVPSEGRKTKGSGKRRK